MSTQHQSDAVMTPQEDAHPLIRAGKITVVPGVFDVLSAVMAS